MGGLGPEPVTVGVFFFFVIVPVFEAAGFDEGDEGSAEGGFGGGGEFEGGNTGVAEMIGEPTAEAFANAGGVTDKVVYAPMVEIGEEALGEGGMAGRGLEMAGALIGEDVEGVVDGVGVGAGWRGAGRQDAGAPFCALIRVARGEGDDGAGGVVTGGVVKLGKGIGGGFILATDVEEGDDGFAVGRPAAGMVTAHEGQTAGREESRGGAQRFKEVFTGDDGVVTAVALHLVFEEASVGGVGGNDLLGTGSEDAAQTVLLGLPFELQFFEPEGVVLGAGGAEVDGGGVASGAHGGEDGLDVGALLVLHFVEDEQVIGRFAAGGGLGMAGEEDDGGFAQDTARGTAGFVPLVPVKGIVEPLFETVKAAAEAVAGGGEDHAAPFAAHQVEQVDEEMGNGFVFAGLATEEEKVLTAVLVADAVDDGVERLQLVGVEGQANDLRGK